MSRSSSNLCAYPFCSIRISSKCRLFQNHLLFLLMSLIVTACCEPFPLVNRCCTSGQEYSIETDECVSGVRKVNTVEYTVESTTFQSNGVANETTVFYGDHQQAEPADRIRFPPQSVIAIPMQPNATEFSFSLTTYLPSDTCTKGNFVVKIRCLSVTVNDSSDVDKSVEPKLTSRGELKIGNEYYSSKEFCLFGFQGDSVSARVCNATCSQASPCVRKCCDLNQVWNMNFGGRASCIDSSDEIIWTPQFYEKSTLKTGREIFAHYQIVHPRYWCNKANRPRVIEQFDTRGNRFWRFRLGTDGTIFRRISRYTWEKNDEYTEFTCIDGGINSKYLPPDQNHSYTGLLDDDILFECNEVALPGSKSQSILYGVVMIFSSVFLLLTLTVYILLWDKQKVHGWTLMSYIVSLFFMYLFFVMMHFSQFVLVQGAQGKLGGFCTFIGVGVDFFFVSTFCWMSMINFDLWCTFKALKPTGSRSKGLKRYLSYAAFSTFVPLAIVSTAVTLDVLYGDDLESGIIVPEFGRRRCLADPEFAQLVYQYGPAGILLMFNLVFFTITVYTMYRIQQSTKFATTSSSKNKKQKQSGVGTGLMMIFGLFFSLSRIRLFAKLLVVMGIPWIFEIVSWFAERGRAGGNAWYWVIFDMINIMQAIAIFFIFVLKRDVIHSLEQKYPAFKGFLDRILMDSDTLEKIGKRFPKLKGIASPFARSNPDVGSTVRTMNTDSTVMTSESSKKGENIKMQDKTLQIH